MIEDNLAKISREDNNESGAEQADNWFHVTPRAKARANNTISKATSFKTNQPSVRPQNLGKATMFTVRKSMGNVVSSITTSLAVVSIASIHVSAVAKQKILAYAGCDISDVLKKQQDGMTSSSLVAFKPSYDESIMPLQSPPSLAALSYSHDASGSSYTLPAMPVDSFGEQNPLICYPNDMPISNAFLSLVGGLEYLLDISNANSQLLKSHLTAFDDMGDTGEEFLLDPDNSFYSALSEGAMRASPVKEPLKETPPLASSA